ncbi:MAG: PspA-associated protein PspAA [Solirubrobacteraceae bacterium]
MIIRIATEGQYSVADQERLHELDNAAVVAADGGSEAEFRSAYDALLEFVRGGEILDADHLGASDLILPPPDVSLAEARSEFTGEGLLPG